MEREGKGLYFAVVAARTRQPYAGHTWHTGYHVHMTSKTWDMQHTVHVQNVRNDRKARSKEFGWYIGQLRSLWTRMRHSV